MGLGNQCEEASADELLCEVTRTNLEFATWHPRYRFDAFDVRIERQRGRKTTRCGISANSPDLGVVSAVSIGSDPYDAVDRASVLIEAEVNLRIADREAPPSVTTWRTVPATSKRADAYEVVPAIWTPNSPRL